MILPIKFFWKQFNGPQITCVMQSIYNKLKTMLDPYLDYLNNLSIKTANSSHLNLIGTLKGIPRAYIEAGSEEYFWFTLNSTQNPNHGMSEVGGTQGGRFTEVIHDTGGRQYVPDAYYRKILQAASESEGEPGSLVFMDDIISAIRGDGNSTWNFVFETAPVGVRTYGDVNIILSQMSDWLSPMVVEAIIQALGDTLYAPEPRVFVDFVE